MHAAGYEVIGAGDRSTGLELARTQSPDLILSDVNMDGFDGFQLLQVIRIGPRTTAMPVIFMTGSESNSRTGMDPGADDYLRKSFTIPDMLAAVRVRRARQQTIEQHARENEPRRLELLSVTQDLVAIANTETTGLL